MLKGLGITSAIIRPTLVYGKGDLLLNNMAWALRRFPVFPVYGSGNYPVQPFYAEDVAAQLSIALGRDAAAMIMMVSTSERPSCVGWGQSRALSLVVSLSQASLQPRKAEGSLRQTS